MAIVKLNSANFNEEIKSGITLVDFYADWCGPCKMIAPFIEQLANEDTGAKIAKIDTDESQDLAERFGVMSIPTLIVFKDGEVVAQHMGFAAKPQIEALIEKAK